MMMDPTLTELLHTNVEWIFVGGKGGVGKTTTSCALATLFATTPISDAASPGCTRPRRVLLISTDPAHNLSDAFNQRFGSHPTPVNGLEESLAAMEVDPKNFTHGALMSSLTGAKNDGSALPSPEEGGADPTSFARIGAVLKEAARTMPGIDEISVVCRNSALRSHAVVRPAHLRHRANRPHAAPPGITADAEQYLRQADES
ncbi:anion-transporting ATPase-like protein [Leishmania tarentolae]|uniref:Anion-transporting ATPase-like protein n=1 Tax=Leishmania tarentolae TaxID=5689 RepID=A0A640KBX3_LEITA|nr:anion-transporting ATPase-like protein [Leishmania tarentolae]